MIRLKDAITEVGNEAEINQLVSSIEKMTDANAHTHAAKELANFLKNKKYQTIMTSLLQIQQAEGHMPHELIQYRDQLLKDLEKEFAKKYGQGAAKHLHSAF
jgi:hypothetical protein